MSRGSYREQPITKAQIQYIQTVRKANGIDDELYDQMKAGVGVTSTTQLTRRQFNELLQRIEPKAEKNVKLEASWKPVHQSAYRSGMHRKPPESKERMVRKVEAILADLKLHWAYVDGMAKRMFGLDAFRWCDDNQTYKVLQALVIHKKRVTGEV